MTLILVLFWMLLCVLCGMLANRRGLDVGAHIALPLLLGIIVIISQVYFAQDAETDVALSRIVGGNRTLPLWATGLGLGVFLVAIGFGHLSIVALLPDNRAVQASTLKKCPQCAEEIQPDAKICRFCRHEFAPSEAP